MRAVVLCILLLTSVFLVSCSVMEVADTSMSAEPIQATADLFAMDTFMTLKAYGPNADALLDIAKERITILEKTLSVTDSESDVWMLNHSNGKSVRIGEDTAAILRGAEEISKLTNGALDISIYPLVSAWGFTTGSYQIPNAETIAELLKLVDYTQIYLDGQNAVLSAGMQIDLGAVAKGYTGDVVASILRDGGVASALLNLGGNVHAVGAKQDGTPWRIAVANPFAPDSNLLQLEIVDKVVITSGNYERYFIGEDGNRYCHILDSETGYPADNGIVSMTIIGECGLTCDALSTALYVCGAERAVQIWRDTQDFEMIYVTTDGTIYLSEGLADCYTNVSGLPLEIVLYEP